LIGRNSGAGVVYNSGFMGTVSAVSDQVGGLVGRQVSAFIEDSYSQGRVTGTNYVGGLSGRSQFASASITNSYSASVISPVANQGGDSLSNYSCRDFFLL
jgi:hypothetical protein